MAGLQTIAHVPYVEKTLVPISESKSVENTGTVREEIHEAEFSQSSRLIVAQLSPIRIYSVMDLLHMLTFDWPLNPGLFLVDMIEKNNRARWPKTFVWQVFRRNFSKIGYSKSL